MEEDVLDQALIEAASRVEADCFSSSSSSTNVNATDSAEKQTMVLLLEDGFDQALIEAADRVESNCSSTNINATDSAEKKANEPTVLLLKDSFDQTLIEVADRVKSACSSTAVNATDSAENQANESTPLLSEEGFDQVLIESGCSSFSSTNVDASDIAENQTNESAIVAVEDLTKNHETSVLNEEEEKEDSLDFREGAGWLWEEYLKLASPSSYLNTADNNNEGVHVSLQDVIPSNSSAEMNDNRVIETADNNDGDDTGKIFLLY